MELIYALLIFFGFMTPSQYTAETHTSFKKSAMVRTLDANPAIIGEITLGADVAARLRVIDRTED